MTTAAHERLAVEKRVAKVRASRLKSRPVALFFDDVATEQAWAFTLSHLPFLGDYKRPGEWVRVNMAVVFPDYTGLTWQGTVEGLRLRLITLSTQFPFDSYTWGLGLASPAWPGEGIPADVALYRVPRDWGEYIADRRGE